MLHDLVDLDRATVEDLDQGLVLVDQGALHLAVQDRGVDEVLDADADAGHLVAVGGADPAAGGADLRLAQEPLGDLVEGHVVGRDDVRVRADHQPRGVHAAGDQAVHLAEQHLEVDHHAVADHRHARGRQDPAGQQVQGELRIADHHGVPGVVAALVAHDVVGAPAEQVGRLALALVAPLGAHDHDRRHGASTLRRVPWGTRNTPPAAGATTHPSAAGGPASPAARPAPRLCHRSRTYAGSMTQWSSEGVQSAQEGSGRCDLPSRDAQVSAPVLTVRALCGGPHARCHREVTHAVDLHDHQATVGQVELGVVLRPATSARRLHPRLGNPRRRHSRRKSASWVLWPRRTGLARPPGSICDAPALRDRSPRGGGPGPRSGPAVPS